MANSLVKLPGDSRLYQIDFSNIDEILDGQTISSATVTATPSGLTLGSPTISGEALVIVAIHGGTAGTLYQLKVTANVSGGSVYVEVIPFNVL